MSDPNSSNPYDAGPERHLGAYGTPMAPVEPGRDFARESVGPPPSSVVNAARLMYVSAAFVLLSFIVLLVARSTVRKAIADKNPSWDAHKLDTALNTAITAGAVIDIIIIALLVLLAVKMRKGRNWARIVTWIITAIGVLSALSSLAQPGAVGSRAFTLIAGLIDIAIFVLLLQKSSNDFFRRRG